MNENIQSVDVEAIMTEIRERIAARGETEDVLSFDESTVGEVCEEGIVGSVAYDEKTLHHFVMMSNEEHNIPYYQMIPKGGIKSFIKRSVRKVIAFIVLPLRDAQNRYNAYTVQSLMQLEAYSLEQKQNMEAYIAEQEVRLEKQEEDMERLTERLQLLEKQYEDLLDKCVGREV